MPSTPHRVADLHLPVPADHALVPGARRRFGAWLALGFAHDGELRDDLCVVLSELLTNAIAASPSGADLTVRACYVDGEVLLEVSNPVAPWVDPTVRWDLDDPLRGGGRGLLIARALVDDLEVVHDTVEQQTTLRCRRAATHG